MTTRAILSRDPDFRALVCSWWDERFGFFPGVTASVVADYLEDHDYDETNLSYVLRWGETMRGDDLYWLADVANVHHISSGTKANPKILHMLQDFGLRLVTFHEFDWHDVAMDARVLLGPDACGMIARSAECRDITRNAPHILYGRAPTRVGPPRELYSYRLVFNEHQPYNQVDCVCRDVIITARVY